ncbi:MAG: transposase [Solirubrobacterales bacterium]|nr:transposase [Solirubrobacterales bacterium]
MQFGRKSEKLEREIQQLELQLQDLEESAAENQQRAERKLPEAAATVFASTTRKPRRGPLPDHLPRQTEMHRPVADNCPECGGELRQLGEDISEILEYVPARFKVIRHVRPKLSCRKCDVIVQAAAPSRPIERGLAGPGLLAHVLVSKYADHHDPVMYFKKYPGRIVSMHCQGVDLNAPLPQPGAARVGSPQQAVGHDSLDWKAIFTAAKTGGLTNYFVELPWDLTVQSVAYLKTLDV